MSMLLEFLSRYICGPNALSYINVLTSHMSSVGPDQHGHLINDFIVPWYILQCPMILLGDDKGPDQTAE